jgi:hypothetical protein
MKRKSLKEFGQEYMGKADLFNSLAKHIHGGDTTSNGHSTASTGADADNSTGDQDEDPAQPQEIVAA